MIHTHARALTRVRAHAAQERVLKLLKESEGMILDNEPLINTLQQARARGGGGLEAGAARAADEAEKGGDSESWGGGGR